MTDSATGIGFAMPLAGQVWSVHNQPRVNISRRDARFVNLDSLPWVLAGFLTVSGGRMRR